MQRWRINGTEQRLCRQCARANRHLLLLQPHTWLGEEKDSGLVCDCCRCTDRVVGRFGKLRWLFYPLFFLLPRPWQPAARAGGK